jgi:hypothetical protein
MFVAENFIRSLVESCGKHTAVYTDEVDDIMRHAMS